MGAITDFLFGKNREQIDKEYSTALKNAGEERAKAVEQAVYNGQLYNANKDLFEEKGIEQPITGGEVSSAYADEMNNLEKERAKAWKQNKYNVLGNGMIGTLINPIIQTGSVVGDMFAAPFRAMAGEETNRYRRDPENDFLSDLGAMGETALTLGTMGNEIALSEARKAVQAGTATAKQAAKVAASQVPKTIGQKVARNALLGAGYGASSSLRDMGFEYFDPGQLTLSTALGAGITGGLAGIGGLWSKYTQPASGNALVPYSGVTVNSGKYQNALNTLGITGDNLTEDALNTARKQATKNIAKTVGYESAEGQAQRTAVNNAYQALLDVVNGKTPGAKAAYNIPKQSFGQKLGNLKTNLGNTKAGTMVSSLLKNNKGKVLAGGGVGLLLAKLMSDKGQNNNQMSDAEMQELYNYIYGGGQ